MFLPLILVISFSFANAAINWNGNNWAFGCDFRNNDLSNVQISGELCGGKCAATGGCTHFTWTTFNGGTCWMKSGTVSQTDAFETGDQSTVCGVVNIAPNPGNTQQSNVLTTFHGANEAGACKLPASGSYAVQYAVALGDVPALGNLKYTNSMCGHVLTVNCGNGDVDIIVMNSNLGGGLDLYGSTWNRVTNNASPGQRFCSVRMTGKNMLSSSGGPICFYEPDSEKNNPYFKLLALFNTGNRLVVSARVEGKGTAAFNGVQPYFAFNFLTSPEDRVNFGLSDGSTHSVRIADCVIVNASQMWN
eukprot:Em0003g1821a